MDNRKESLVLVRLKTQAKTIASTKAIPEVPYNKLYVHTCYLFPHALFGLAQAIRKFLSGRKGPILNERGRLRPDSLSFFLPSATGSSSLEPIKLML